jgi:PAS domain S-box-containing protein
MPDKDVILIVEDSEQNRYTLSRWLQRAGFTTWEARTGHEALELAQRNPSLITLDVQLPDLNGFDLCQRLKSDARTSSIPILQTSATFVDSRDKIQGLQGGADGYLIQPVDPEELIATVRALLRVRRAEAAATKLANEWKTTFDAIPDAICLLDVKGRVERCNVAFARLIGKSAPEMIERPMAELLLHGGGNEAALRELAEMREGHTEVTLGERRFKVSLSPVDSDTSETLGRACVFSDITTIWNADRTLRNLNEELETRVRARTAALEDANDQLESFCYSVAHDLRTPLRAMHAFSEILVQEQSQSLSSEGVDMLGRIHRASKRMELLIQDLLVYSRLAIGDIVLESIVLADVVAEVIASHRNDALVDHNVSIAIDVSPAFKVVAHRSTLTQAIWNLVSNAAKFTRPGAQPKVRITAQKRGDRIRLVVADNGIGIAPEHRDRIFKMFEKIQTDSSGTGVGLPIVRRAMERMDGGVGFESQLGSGSSFWIELREFV